MFGKCLEGVWMGSAGCLKGILRVSMVHPKGMWGVYIYLKGKSGLVKSGKVESLQVRSGKVKSGQVKSSWDPNFFGPKIFLIKTFFEPTFFV